MDAGPADEFVIFRLVKKRKRVISSNVSRKPIKNENESFRECVCKIRSGMHPITFNNRYLF